MPRLTNSMYLTRRHFVMQTWAECNGCFAALTLPEQRSLHLYYRTAGQLTDQEAIRHRMVVTQREPLLPALSGKAFVHLFGAQARHQLVEDLLPAVEHRHEFWRSQLHQHKLTAPARSGHRVTHVTARGVLKPEPDLKHYARAVLKLAIQLQAGESTEFRSDKTGPS